MPDDTFQTGFLNEPQLRGLRALVTGSSSGIGAEIARQLAAAGAQVVVHGHQNAEAAKALAQSIQGETLLFDLADVQQRNDLVSSAWQLAPIDIWVNNAGADVLTGDASAWPFDKKLEQLWKVDVTATVQLSRQIGSRMKQRGQGVILNMGWDQVETGMAGESGEMFAATKGAIMAFSRSLAKSLAPQVRVNCLAPGWIKTAWGNNTSEYWQERAVRESMLERWGTPRDVAQAACFLASPQASFITGQIFCVNGGMQR